MVAMVREDKLTPGCITATGAGAGATAWVPAAACRCRSAVLEIGLMKRVERTVA